MDTERAQGRRETRRSRTHQAVHALLSVAGGALVTLLALAAPARGQNYCCVCFFNLPPPCLSENSPCQNVCDIVADAAACDLFCSKQCSLTGGCIPLPEGGCDFFGNRCGPGTGFVCDLSGTFATCCDPSVPGSHCAGPTQTPTETPTATVTDTPTNTPTVTPTNTPVPQGGACTTPSQCSTGFCVDDVCCNSACTSGRCDLPGQRGTCSGLAPVPALAPRALAILVALLLGVAVFTLRRRRIRR